MSDNNKKFIDEHIKPEMFEFVQKDQKIYDKKFETKPIGYFKDAMIRFGKNKTNVTATIILFTLILLSILVPILTNKNYEKQDSVLSLLPPRIPLLEKIGIADGTKKFTDITVDPETIGQIESNPDWGYPRGYNPDFIIKGTLTNSVESCVISDEACKGGENKLLLNANKSAAAIMSAEKVPVVNDDGEIQYTDSGKIRYQIVPVFFDIYSGVEGQIEIDIDFFAGDEYELNVYVVENVLNTTTKEEIYELKRYKVTTINEAGTITITFDDIFNEIDNPNIFYLATPIILELKGTPNVGNVVLNSITYTYGENTIVHSGYTLSTYALVPGEEYNGLYVRQNGTLQTASFKYDAYGALFEQDLLRENMSTMDYEGILTENKDVCGKIPDESEYPYDFPEGCPITRVEERIQSAPKEGGGYYYNYKVYIDYKIELGFEEIPYYIFGTEQEGKDYFALIFLGLRTSLMLGLIVAVINISIGIIYGSIEGYYGGTVDLLMERFAEIAGRIPWLVWLGLFVVIFGSGPTTLILVLTVTGWLGIASVTRTQFYRYKGREYVLASRTLGAKDMRIIFRHILPNGIGTIITSSVLMIPYVIFSESTISYLGFGLGGSGTFDLFGFVELPATSIGYLLYRSRPELTTNPYLIFFPAIIIAILMITFNMFGNALRDAFNPTLRGSE